MKQTIAIKTPSGGYLYFHYLEDVAEWLGRVHHRQIDIADELESQITDVNGCEFYIDGTRYWYEQIEEE